MTNLLLVAELSSPDFEPEITVDGRTPEFSYMLLADLLKRCKIVHGSVRKLSTTTDTNALSANDIGH